MSSPGLATEAQPVEPGSVRLGVMWEVIAFAVAYVVLSGVVAIVVLPDVREGTTSGQELLIIQVALIVLTVPLVGAFLRYRREAWKVIGLTLPQSWLKMALTGAALGTLIKFLSLPLGLLLWALGVEGAPLDLTWDSPADRVGLIVGGSLAGVHEELVFRGFLRNRVARLVNDPVAGGGMLRTGLPISIVFGLLHVTQGLSGVIVVTFAGVAFFAIAMNSKLTLLHAILAHATFNALAMLAILATAG